MLDTSFGVIRGLASQLGLLLSLDCAAPDVGLCDMRKREGEKPGRVDGRLAAVAPDGSEMPGSDGIGAC